MNPLQASEVFRRLDRELWVVTAAAGPKRGGLIATFVSQASIVPQLPRMVVGLARHHHTWQLVEHSRAFALHLLGEEHLDWVERFGMTSGADHDKLAGLAVHVGASGAPILEGALGWLDCRVEAALDTGDRTVYLAEVVDAKAPGDRTILTAKRMLELASPEQKQTLRRQMDDDAAIDARAIKHWREDHARKREP
jgi:flavin reductase (DIM6/NTAB) family NADH-FMN oxidoreductase RutF